MVVAEASIGKFEKLSPLKKARFRRAFFLELDWVPIPRGLL